MQSILIVTPPRLTLDDLSTVLARRWPLTGSATQPRVQLDPDSRAYLDELEMDPDLDEELFLDDPGARERMRSRLGDFRVFALRYSDPGLAREIALTLAESSLADEPIFLSTDESFLPAHEYVRANRA